MASSLEPSAPQASAATWDAQAARYSRQEPLEAQAIAVALRFCDARRGERLVDLGTGTGVLVRALARLPEQPSGVVAVDSSAGMLARIGELPHRWRTIKADARSVPLAQDCAEVVSCAYLLHLLPPHHRGAVLAEARRILRDEEGSRLVVVTVWADPRRIGGRLLFGLLSLSARLWPTRLGGLAPLDPTPDLEAAGFVVTRRAGPLRGGYPSLVLCAAPRQL